MLETQWVCFRKPISQVLYFFEAMTSSSWNGGTWPSGAFVSHFEKETARGWFVQWEEVGQTQQKIKEGTLSKASMEAHEFPVPRPKRYSSAEDAEYPCILKQVRLDLANLVVFLIPCAHTTSLASEFPEIQTHNGRPMVSLERTAMTLTWYRRSSI